MRIKPLICKVFILSVLGFFSAFGCAFAQGHLLLLNGKERRFDSAKVEGEYIRYKPEADTGKSKKIDRLDVFSINYDDGNEEIIYTPDTTFQDEPSVEDVKLYIEGQQYAQQYFSDNPRYRASQLYFGFYSGFIGSFLGYYGAATPLVYSMVVDRFGPERPKEKGEGWSEDEVFISGYEKKMRDKKIKFSLIGGSIGFGIGIATFAAIFID